MIALTFATTVHIGVLGSFHPMQLEVRPARRSVLVVEEPGRSEVIQTPEFVRLDGPAKIAGPKGSFTWFTICLPNGIEREYFGRLEVRRHFYELQLIVEMDREVAVASILAAEGAYALPPEALRAQAIAARSYMLAVGGRHDGFDMCDTTHCQRLEGPPSPHNVVTKAALATRAEVLIYQNKIVPAMYSANCGGHTKKFAAAGLAAGDYPFYAVECSRQGHASGHGVGLCQLGAMDMAAAGANAAEILAHYFPGTEIAVIDMNARRLMPIAKRIPYDRASAYEKRMRSVQTLGGPTAMLKNGSDSLLHARLAP
jgi:hypothetical protein